MSPVVDVQRGAVYVLYPESHNLVALDRSTGQKKWSQSFHGGNSSALNSITPVVDPRTGTLYCAAMNGTIHAVEPLQGNARPLVQGNRSFGGLQVDPEDPLLYCAGSAGIQAIDLGSGRVVRRHGVAPAVGTSCVDRDRGTVVTMDASGNLSAFEAPPTLHQRISDQRDSQAQPRPPLVIEVRDKVVRIGGTELQRHE